MRRGPVSLLALLALAFPAFAGHSEETHRYIAGPGDTQTPICLAIIPGGPEIGGACFSLTTSATSVTIRVDDDHAMPVGGWYSFVRTGGARTAALPFCGSFTAAVPAGGAGVIEIALGEATSTALCALKGVVGAPAVTGSVTARIH